MYHKKEMFRTFFIILAVIFFIFLFSKFANVVVEGDEYFSPLSPMVLFYEFVLLFLLGFVIAQLLSNFKVKVQSIKGGIASNIVEKKVKKEIKPKSGEKSQKEVKKEPEENIEKDLKKLDKKLKKLL